MIILGIDPGTATTGYGVIEKLKNQQFKILDFGVIETPKDQSDAERLYTIYTDLSALIQKYKPATVGIEKLFFTTNQKTIITVAQARGVALLCCETQRLTIYEYTPLQVKNRLTGYGKAEKKQVQFMVQHTFGLQRLPKPDDAADALAIALCASFEK